MYIVLLVISTLTLVFYTGSIQRSENRILLTPSQSTYEQLITKHSATLQCPCSTVSIAQHSFISHIDASLHPVCLSALVSEEWLNYFKSHYRIAATSFILRTDFRRWGPLLFKTLTSLCLMANETLGIAIREYQERRFVSNQILPKALFEAEINASMKQFQSSTSTIFRSVLGPIRAVTQGNALMTLLETNWVSKLEQYALDVPLLTVPFVYNNSHCSCATSSSCFEPTAFLNGSNVPYYTVENIFQGCTPLDSLLMSSLSCFFSETCLNAFLSAIPLANFPPPWGEEFFSMAPLNFSSNNTQFQTNDTLETIINALFIGSWSSDISYERYFNACQPLHCTHLHEQRLDVVYVATTFLSIFSGLSTILRFGTPRLMLIVKKSYDHFRRVWARAI